MRAVVGSLDQMALPWVGGDPVGSPRASWLAVVWWAPSAPSRC